MNSLPPLVFTYDWYEKLLTHLVAAGYTFEGFEESVDDREIRLRHDIDYSPEKAVKIAHIEAERDITSTYFFLSTSPLYNIFEPSVVDAVRTIRDLGHDIGLHFSTHAYWEAEPETATLVEQVERERQRVTEASDGLVETVSFHNPPEWVLDRSFDGFTSTYAPHYFADIQYVADSNQRWRDENPFDGDLPGRIQLLTHPFLWDERDGDVIDRMRRERDRIVTDLERHFSEQNRLWSGPRGLDSDHAGDDC